MNARPQVIPQLHDGLRAGLEAVSAAVLVHDGEHLVFANDAMLRLLGCTAADLPELAPDWLVYDDGLRETFGDRILGARKVLAGGFFDGAWRLASGAGRGPK